MSEKAKCLVYVRPLVPYSGRRFDIDGDNPHLSFQVRRQLWSAFPVLELDNHELRFRRGQ